MYFLVLTYITPSLSLRTVVSKHGHLCIITNKANCVKQWLKILVADSYDLSNNINNNQGRNYMYNILI